MSQIVQHAKNGRLPNSRFLIVGGARYTVHQICWTVKKSTGSAVKIHAVQLNAHVAFMRGGDKVATLRHGTLAAMNGRRILLGKKRKLGGLSGLSRKAMEAVANTFVEDADYPEQDTRVFCMNVGPHLTLLSPEHQGTVDLSHDFVEDLRRDDRPEPANAPGPEYSNEEVAFAVRDSRPRGRVMRQNKNHDFAHSAQKPRYAQPRIPIVEHGEYLRLEDGEWVTETRTFVDGIEQHPLPAIGERPDTIMSRAFRERFCRTPAGIRA